MKRSTLKRLAIALAIIAFVIFQAYLETSLNFTPNH
jgi:DMSO/TMAO reductase YedYZ heme-binding membrane subunit